MLSVFRKLITRTLKSYMLNDGTLVSFVSLSGPHEHPRALGRTQPAKMPVGRSVQGGARLEQIDQRSLMFYTPAQKVLRKQGH